MSSSSKKNNRVEYKTRMGWVRLDQMKINPLAQRGFDRAHAEDLTSNFDPDIAGNLHVSERDGWYYVVDGQHRRAAYIAWLGDSSQQVLCHIYEGLTAEQEAELFLQLNHQKKQTPMSRYQVALTAGRPDETDVDRIIRSLGLKIGTSKAQQEIGCITAILSTYTRQGPGALSWSLRIIRDSYGFDGFKPNVIRGLALVTNRYGNQIDEDQMVNRLKRMTLPDALAKSKQLRDGLGTALDRAFAATAVDAYNRGRGKKIDPWFRESYAA